MIAADHRSARLGADHQRQHLLGSSTFVPGDDDPAPGRPPARRLHLGDKALEESVSRRERAVVSVVRVVWGHPDERRCASRVQIGRELRERDDLIALGWIAADRGVVHERVVIHVVLVRAERIRQVAGDRHVLDVRLPPDAGGRQLVGELRARISRCLWGGVPWVVVDGAGGQAEIVGQAGMTEIGGAGRTVGREQSVEVRHGWVTHDSRVARVFEHRHQDVRGAAAGVACDVSYRHQDHRQQRHSTEQRASGRRPTHRAYLSRGSRRRVRRHQALGNSQVVRSFSSPTNPARRRDLATSLVTPRETTCLAVSPMRLMVAMSDGSLR